MSGRGKVHVATRMLDSHGIPKQALAGVGCVLAAIQQPNHAPNTYHPHQGTRRETLGAEKYNQRLVCRLAVRLSPGWGMGLGPTVVETGI